MDLVRRGFAANRSADPFPFPLPHRRFTRSIATLALLIAPAVACSPEQERAEPPTAFGWSRVEVRATGKARGLLVLVPGYNDDATGLGREGPDVARHLRTQGVTTVVVAPSPPTLFYDAASVRALDSLVAELRAAAGVPASAVVIGGLSAGGVAAVQLGGLCARGPCATGGPLGGVFEVDAPLDMLRMWRGEQLTLQRNNPRSNVTEARLVMDAIRGALGGDPEQATAAYAERSPLAAFLPEGGNARHLRATPVRAYTEPDVAWWIEQRGTDYYAMNALDAAALINQLRQLGNRRAELVLTTGRGYRPDGRRHPHSWSIVDEADLARWVVSLVEPSAGTR